MATCVAVAWLVTEGRVHDSAGYVLLALVLLRVVWGFIGTPFNDNNPNDAVVTPFASGVGATFSGKWDAPEGNNTTLLAQLPNILNNRAYINFHTVQFPGGELRGAIGSELAPVPEPSTMLLVGFGLAGLMRSRKPETH